MGTALKAHFLQKIVDAPDVVSDQDHIDFVLVNYASLPSRPVIEKRQKNNSRMTMLNAKDGDLGLHLSNLKGAIHRMNY